MDIVRSVRQEVSRYVDRQIDYAEFRSSVTESYVSSLECGDDNSTELKLCRAIEWECASYSEGSISEDQLKMNLLCLTMVYGPYNITPGSQNVTFLLNCDASMPFGMFFATSGTCSIASMRFVA